MESSSVKLIRGKIESKLYGEFPIGLNVEYTVGNRCDTIDIGKNFNTTIIHYVSDDSPDVELIPKPISMIRINTIWGMNENSLMYDEYKNLWN